METKESLIEKIDFCETVLKTMIELEDNIKKLKEKELELQKEHKDIVDEGPWDRGTLIFYCVFVGLLCAGVGLIATVIIGLFTASWKSFIIYGAAALGVMAMIWRQKDAIEKSKFEIPTKLAENERKLEEIAEEIKEAQRKSDEYLDSDDFSKAMEFIPHDYFYIAAMEKFKYFLVNGHADTMKEAVKLYDEYLHREKLDFEATRTADEAKRAADMSTATAIAAKETSEYARIMTEQNESIEYWTKRNARAAEKINRKLK